MDLWKEFDPRNSISGSTEALPPRHPDRFYPSVPGSLAGHGLRCLRWLLQPGRQRCGSCRAPCLTNRRRIHLAPHLTHTLCRDGEIGYPLSNGSGLEAFYLQNSASHFYACWNAGSNWGLLSGPPGATKIRSSTLCLPVEVPEPDLWKYSQALHGIVTGTRDALIAFDTCPLSGFLGKVVCTLPPSC